MSASKSQRANNLQKNNFIIKSAYLQMGTFTPACVIFGLTEARHQM